MESKLLRQSHQDRAAPGRQVAGPTLAELPEELLGRALLLPGQNGESAAGRRRLAVGVECGDSLVSLLSHPPNFPMCQ